jgi:hypothetical protein
MPTGMIISTKPKTSKSRPSLKKKGAKGKRLPAFFSEASTQYNGPLILPKSMQQEEVQPINMNYYFPLNATVGGVIDNVYGEQSVVNASDWASISASFHEFRVLAFEMEYVPLVSYTTNYPPFVGVVDRSVTATLGAYTSAANHESCRIWSSRYPHKILAKMSGVEEADWVSTSTAINHYYIKMYASGFTASQNVGTILFKYLVQFRGRA